MSHTNLRDLVRPDPRERRVQLDDGIPPCEGQCGYSRFDVPERFHLVEYRKGRSWWLTHCCEQCALGHGHGRLCFFACRRCGVETPPEELDNATHVGCKGDLDRGERRILRRLPERRRALLRFY